MNKKLLFCAVNFCLTFVFLLGLVMHVSAQDSTLVIKRFTFEDIKTEKFAKYKLKSSTNRLAENPEDLVHEVIIIDGDDIRKFGYSTLVDVLKTIPGFLTSQPGNSTEGETFLMRGILGNDYAKILINGVPIKPEAAKSLPIATQLPIRHAEYIEIVQGPASATYGSDAMAGVINIVFPEINRPVFAWADVSISTPQINFFNLTLGGKAGAGKNILNYELFASSYKANDVNLRLPKDSIRIDTSTLSNIQKTVYFGEADDKSLPETNELKRESRVIGLNLQFRWFELNAMNMFREEHSGFGYNPMVASYHDPNSTTGENINTISLKHNYSNNKNVETRSSVSFLSYKTLPFSSYYSVTDFLSNGKNFIYARSIDARAEFQGIIKLGELFKMAVGTNFQYSVSNPYTAHLDKPFRPEGSNFSYTDAQLYPITPAGGSAIIDSISYIDSVTWIPKRILYNNAAFVHFLYKARSGKLNIESAARVDRNSIVGWQFTPKIGMVYRPIKRLKLVAYYSKGHRAPRSYYEYNNYYASLTDFNNGASLTRSRNPLKTEQLQSGEVRAKWRLNQDLTIGATYFAHLMKNRIFRQNFTPPDALPGTLIDTNLRVGVGYFNTASTSFLNSTLFTFDYHKKIGGVQLDIKFGYQFANGWEEVEPKEGSPDDVVRSSEYRFMPEHSFKLNFIVEFKGFTVSVNNNCFGHYVTDLYRVNSTINYTETNNYYYNMDLMIYKTLFRELNLFVGAYNVFNTVQSGIPASTVTNSWDFNPQYGRVLKLGVNFRLN